MSNEFLNGLQAASNAVAGNVAGPVDILAFLLRKAGMPVPENAIGGSNWMTQKGLMAPVRQGASQVIGETAGLLGPAMVSQFGPQIARGLLKGGENLAAPRTLNPQAGAVVYHGSPHKLDSSKIGTGEGAPEAVFDESLLSVALKDTNAFKGLASYDIQADVQGVMPGKLKQLDRGIVSGKYSADDVAAAYENTREALRQRYGDKVTLWRADAPAAQQTANAQTVYMADKSVAQKFANNGREAKPFDVNIDDILAVYTTPSGYYEAIVRKSALGK